MSGRSSRENRRRALEEARQSQRRRKRRLRAAVWGGAAVIAAGAGIGLGLGLSGSSPASPGSSGSPYAPLSSLGTLAAAPAQGTPGAEGMPVPDAPALAAPSAATAGQPVDGISCQNSEQTVFHIHTHLAIFVNGAQRQVPPGIGIPGAVTEQTAKGPFAASGKCFYFLHTHSPDGIIHIESPVQRTYTLGEFFDEWQQPLSASQVGPAKGKVTAIVNGEVYRGNPRDIPLSSRENVTLEVGTPLLAPQTVNWSVTGL